MPKVTFISATGDETTLDIASELSVMEGAIKNSVSGIDADCGGACACATCHVYVDPAWEGRIPAKGDMEASMLEFALDVQDNSRLSCQIKVTPDLDGLVVRLPKSQH